MSRLKRTYSASFCSWWSCDFGKGFVVLYESRYRLASKGNMRDCFNALSAEFRCFVPSFYVRSLRNPYREIRVVGGVVVRD